MDAAFFNVVRDKLFGGALTQQAVDGINAIGHAWRTYGDGDPRKLAYILATAYHESDCFKALEEYASGTAYEGRRDLGNTMPGDGKRFKGRGFVMLTGRRNYADWAKRLGLDIVASPGLVTVPTTAARILVQGMMLGTFTTRKLADFINERICDFINARRVVNGTDRAETISEYARTFLRALEASQKPAPIPPPPDIPPIAPKPPAPKDVAGKGIWAAVGAVVATLIGAFGKAMGWW